MESLCFRYRIGGWLSLRCSCSFRGWTGCLSSQRVALFHQQHRWSQWNDGKRQRSRSAGMRIWGSRVPGLTPVNTFVFSHHGLDLNTLEVTSAPAKYILYFVFFCGEHWLYWRAGRNNICIFMIIPFPKNKKIKSSKSSEIRAAE